jgi:hypothetical protein
MILRLLQLALDDFHLLPEGAQNSGNRRLPLNGKAPMAWHANEEDDSDANGNQSHGYSLLSL